MSENKKKRKRKIIKCRTCWKPHENISAKTGKHYINCDGCREILKHKYKSKCENKKCVICSKNCAINAETGKIYTHCSECRETMTQKRKNHIESLKKQNICSRCLDMKTTINVKTGEYHLNCSDCRKAMAKKQKKRYESLKRTSVCAKCRNVCEIKPDGEYYIFCDSCRIKRKKYVYFKKHDKDNSETESCEICEHDVKFNIETQRYEDCKICATQFQNTEIDN
jgi:hypothetical protein